MVSSLIRLHSEEMYFLSSYLLVGFIPFHTQEPVSLSTPTVTDWFNMELTDVQAGGPSMDGLPGR
jgi:hypothetical protein